MASLWCVSAAPLSIIYPAPPVRNPNCGARSGVLSVSSPAWAARRRRSDFSVCMRWSRADEEEDEERSNRNPLDIPLDYERPKPPNRLNVFPKFPPMQTPLTDWLPFDEFPDDEVDEEELEEEEQEQPME